MLLKFRESFILLALCKSAFHGKKILKQDVKMRSNDDDEEENATKVPFEPNYNFPIKECIFKEFNSTRILHWDRFPLMT